jgi:hypothetical protein
MKNACVIETKSKGNTVSMANFVVRSMTKPHVFQCRLKTNKVYLPTENFKMVKLCNVCM